MNIFEALKLVGRYPVVEGWSRTICFIAGFFGMMVWIIATCYMEDAGFKPDGLVFCLWIIVLIFFTTMHVLPIYIQ